MKDQTKTRQTLIGELASLKERIAELEQSELKGKQAEEKLRESQERLLKEQKFTQLLLDTSPAFIVAIDFDGKTLMMNRSGLHVKITFQINFSPVLKTRHFQPDLQRFRHGNHLIHRLIRCPGAAF